MGQSEDLLQMAERHVREGEARVARQAALVDRIAARGLDSARAERVLGEFRIALELARSHLRIERQVRGLQQ